MIGTKRYGGVAMQNRRRKEPEPTTAIPTPLQLRRMRLELGLTQKVFGLALGLAGKYCAHTVSRWERGLAQPNSASLYILRSRIKKVRLQRELERSLL